MIKHALFGGLTNLIRSFWLSATAITVLTVSLGSVALVASFSTIVGYAIRQFDNQISIVAFYKEGTPRQDIDISISEIRQLPEVKEVQFTDKNQAREELVNNSRAAKDFMRAIQNQNESFALEYITVTPKTSESYQKIYDHLKDPRFEDLFDSVLENFEFINNLQRVYYWTNIVGIVLVMIFSLVSILVMVNMLRIAVYNRRNEIEIMRLVGATNGYIRGPFVAEGAYFNIIAASIILLIFIPLIGIIIPRLESYLRISVATNTNLIFQVYTSIITTVFIGILAGVVTAYLATRRYLKL